MKVGEVEMKEYIITAFDSAEIITLRPFHIDEVPELIRCRNCKHYDSFSQECRDGIDGIITPGFYCANGERKEGR